MNSELEDIFKDAIGRRTVLLDPEQELEISISLRGAVEAQQDKGMILVGLFRDETGKPIAPPYKGWWQTRQGAAYTYVTVEPHWGDPEERWMWTPQVAAGATALEVGLLPWQYRGRVSLETFETRFQSGPSIARTYGLSGAVEPNLQLAELERMIENKVFHGFFELGRDDLWILQVELEGLESDSPRGAVVRLIYFDETGEIIPGPYFGFEKPANGDPFAYLSTTPAFDRAAGEATRLFALDRPEGAALAFVAIERWVDKGEYVVSDATRLYPGDADTVADLIRRFRDAPNFGGHGNFLKAALRFFQRTGRLGDELKLLDLSAGTILADHVRQRRSAIEAIHVETDPEWLPISPSRHGKGRLVGPPDRIMTLMKVCMPFENSGGAVRNYQTVRVLRELGWSPYAVTPLGYPGPTSIPAKESRTEQAGLLESNADMLAAEESGASEEHEPSEDAASDPDAIEGRIEEQANQGEEEAPEDSEYEVRYTTAVDGVPHIHLNMPRRQFGGARADRLLEFETSLLASLYRRFGGRLIHAVSGYRGYENALKALALKAEFGVPVLYDFRSFHEHTWGSGSAANLDADLTRMRARQEDRCVREADHTVVISEAMRSMLIGRGGDPDRISVVPNGVELDKFASIDEQAVMELREELGISLGARVHGYISNMSAREGHSVLLRAHRDLVTRFPDLVCLLVGDGPLRPQLEKLARDLGVADSVVFVGEVAHERIQLYYQLFHVFVVPRVHDYASDYVTPIKPFEAMAANRPIVMSDLPVTREILGEAEDRGLVARAGDPEALANRIATLLADPFRAVRLADAGRRWVEAERSWSSVLARYDDIYQMLGASRTS